MKKGSSLKRTALAAALLALASPALSAETGSCGKFAWPIEADKALLASPRMVESGSTIDASRPTAVRVVLVGADKAGLAIPPAQPAPPSAPAGTVLFMAEAGLYQFTLTDRVWIDVAQNGAAIDEAGFSGVLDCDGARKSVRFALKGGPVTLQFSGSPSRTVALSITRLPASAATSAR